jgi:hypothetical protein
MGNCYEACQADLDETLEMVAGNRQRTPDDVRSALVSMKERYSSDPEYQRLRARFPSEFPV